MQRLAPNATFFALLALLALLSTSACQQKPSDGVAGSTQAGFQQSVRSHKELFELVISTQEQTPVPINQFHNWVIALSDAEGKPVYPAAFAVRGGMPAHGHGLPSQPIVTRHLGEGAYLLEGVKFNMDGQWRLQFHILAGDLQDAAELVFDVSY